MSGQKRKASAALGTEDGNGTPSAEKKSKIKEAKAELLDLLNKTCSITATCETVSEATTNASMLIKALQNFADKYRPPVVIREQGIANLSELLASEAHKVDVANLSELLASEAHKVDVVDAKHASKPESASSSSSSSSSVSTTPTANSEPIKMGHFYKHLAASALVACFHDEMRVDMMDAIHTIDHAFLTEKRLDELNGGARITADDLLQVFGSEVVTHLEVSWHRMRREDQLKWNAAALWERSRC